MSYKLQVIKYIISDYLSSSIAWLLFYIFRKVYVEPIKFGYRPPLEIDEKLFLGLIIIPPFWILLYYLTGYYKDVYRKSRLNDIGQTIFQCMIGVTVLFFLIILDDVIDTYKNYYLLYFVLFGLHLFFTLTPRYIITSCTVKKIHTRKLGFNTIIIGSNSYAVEIYQELQKQEKPAGNKIIGFVYTREKDYHQIGDFVPNLGSVKNFRQIMSEHKAEEVIIALDPNEHQEINKILNKLADCNIIIKVIPSMFDILTGKVKLNHIYGAPLIQLSHDMMPVWQANVKQLLDIVISVLSLVILFPLILFLAIGVKLSSPGPVIYSHERIGRYGKLFKIFKFRSMYANSEINGPELSSREDNRPTNFGRFMRKYRLDEIPNFINVLRGEMSLVGPRPERKHYVDQIVKKAPHYVHLHKVKPGITSWGQVKYGYAENVDQMIKRLRYDILYIENMSLFVDLKILFYTILTIFKGRGV